MLRSEIGAVLGKLELLEDRNFSSAQSDAWFEILGQHSLQDAVDAVQRFHSKPFKRPAYPGDIKALIVDVEDVRLRRCGTVEANEADFVEADRRTANARLRTLIATAQWSAQDYREYRRSKLSINGFTSAKGALPVG
ncbi:hypothetical protein [Arthrobacter sp. fls2-241-R2A-172]|uniref:hypothetical protein n=1 Tax=Arthrobacter sp. fls2-241-R2A-172 TaxID=3040325 RepID=UPI00254AC74B|nr:hypothetical protein [Arthrobacter sp. fls2-241-R2A-172]